MLDIREVEDIPKARESHVKDVEVALLAATESATKIVSINFKTSKQSRTFATACRAYTKKRNMDGDYTIVSRGSCVFIKDNIDENSDPTIPF